ncbi:MAG: ABC-F family ATP-binding cassette domain-containing protein [Cyclobacteriaceae bacterium]|nr:ABC-F family ATP-binding cassette domain-containing protein [Cyclobacteriaceae bacterium]
MNYLSAEGLSKSFHDKWLFKDISFGIAQGEKLALVGENGAGKSTLLKILTGQLESDGGLVAVAQGVTMGYLMQQPVVAGNLSVNQILFDEANEVARVVNEYEACIHQADTDPDRMQRVLERMDELNAWEYEGQVQEITSKLGITDLEQRFGTLSGGQRKRVFLAQLLLKNPSLIILDEPTNHLDLEAIEWLETYLGGKNITLIMVTHDRYFLDNVANEILELDRGKLYRYKGNYAYFLEKKALREELLKIEVSKAKSLLKKELEWMRKQPKARGTKAKYRIDAFYDLQEVASQNLKKDKLELDIKEARQGGKIMELHHVTKRLGGKVMVDDFSYVFKKKDRIGIVGKNGVGKSTFLNLITGQTAPDQGEVIPGVTTKIGYFTQEVEDLNPANRIIEEVKNIAEFITLSDGSSVSASKFLDQFLFPPEKQYTYIEKLSGGERKRLQLLKILVTNPNFLVLDEPTNDFDIDTLNVLEDFLEQFNGCLVLVSHDRYFMDHLVDELFVFEGEGKISPFNGNYTDYRAWVDEREARLAARATASAKPEKTPGAMPAERKPTFQEKQEYEAVQRDIAALEQERKELGQQLSGSSDIQQIQTLSARFGEVEKLLEQKTVRWIELEEIMEKA